MLEFEQCAYNIDAGESLLPLLKYRKSPSNVVQAMALLPPFLSSLNDEPAKKPGMPLDW